MRQRFIVTDTQSLSTCLTAMTKRHRAGETFFVVIDDKDETRSQAQNRLYWLWIGVISAHTGDDKDSLHVELKRRLLSRIYAKSDGNFAELFASLKQCQRHLSTADYERMAYKVAGLLSTTKATTEQFTEYLQEIDIWAGKQGISLPVPDDLRWVMIK